MMVANAVHEREYLDRSPAQRQDSPLRRSLLTTPENSTLTRNALKATMEHHRDDVAESG